MLRSLLLSRLRRHDCRSVAQPLGRRGACWTKSRGYAPSVDDVYTDDVDHPIGYRKRHLYLVLDDWNKGFSIHKLDLANVGGGDLPLPLPAPVHRQEKTHGSRGHWQYDLFRWNFAPLGSKIIAAGALDPDEDGVTLTYDTATAGVSAVPRLPAALRCPWRLAAAVGNGLYVFEPNSVRDSRCNLGYSRKGNVVVGNGMHRLDLDRQHWTWGSIPSMLPFSVHDMESCVVRPDEGGGCWGTLFVSAGQWDRKHDRYDEEEEDQDFIHTSETFSYAGAGQWRRHGEWGLPFCGQGQYDGELDAWVGLHKIHGPPSWQHYADIAHHTDGYLCSSDVISPDDVYTAQPPAWKLCGERLFDPDDVCHVGASLVYMGDSTYCLVKVEAPERFEMRHGGNKSVIRLAIFRLKYGKSGELIITARRPDRSYLFSRFDDNRRVTAFWI